MSAPEHPPDLRPRPLPKLIDDGSAFWRANLGTLLAFEAAVFLAQTLFEIALGLVIPALHWPAAHWNRFDWDINGNNARLLVDLLVDIFVSVWTMVTAVRFLGGRWTGAAVTWREAVRYTMKRTLRVVVGWLLAIVGTLAGGIGGFLLLLPVALALWLVGGHTLADAMILGAGIGAILFSGVGMFRAVGLEGGTLGMEAWDEPGSRRRNPMPPFGKGRVRQELRFLVLVAVSLVAYLTVMLVDRLILAGLFLVIPKTGAVVNQALRLLSEFADGAFSDTITWTLTTVFLFDLRARFEGFDIQRALAARPDARAA